MKKKRVHSEEWINEARDYWWNEDYLELLSKRLNLNNIESMADIGCGKGYMSFKLIPYMKKVKKIVGIDKEEAHIKDAISISKNLNNNIDFKYFVGDAQNMDIADNSIDFTVCQTLLLHVSDPKAVITEMKRITKDSGIIVAIETNNSINSLISNSMLGDSSNSTQVDNISETLNSLEYELTIQKGKLVIGQGYNSIGDFVPKLFSEAGLKDINVFICDKACSLIPPYDTEEKKSRVKELLTWIDENSAQYNYDEMLNFYIRGGGIKEKFDKEWNKQENIAQKIKKALLEEKYICPGGALMYIVIGRK